MAGGRTGGVSLKLACFRALWLLWKDRYSEGWVLSYFRTDNVRGPKRRNEK